MNATSSKKDKVGLFSEKTALARKFFVGASAIALFALSGQEAQATTTIWMDGVSESSGWVDYNKSWDNDNLLCWAASSSNIIEWWQNKASAAGISIPAGTPTSDIFSVFKSTFGNQAIGTDVGWEWYFTGYFGLDDFLFRRRVLERLRRFTESSRKRLVAWLYRSRLGLQYLQHRHVLRHTRLNAHDKI